MLPSDLLPVLLDFLSEDRSALCQCLLANSQISNAAASVLYSRVILRPKYGQSSGILDCLLSGSLPRYALHVRTLSVKGFLFPNVVSTLPISETLLAAVKAFKNLKALEILPDIYPDDFFTEIIHQGLDLPLLTTLRVNSSCMSEGDSAILARFDRLRILELRNPTRAILNILPEWLAKMGGLNELHLTSNCGSVTPGVLRALIPLLQEISAISLGLSYSITDDDLFDFLGQLPNLKSAQLQHYLQYKVTDNTRQMNRLRSLTVLHNPMDDAESMARICAWVRHAVAGAPIERLQLCCDEFEESSFAPRTFDALLRDIAFANGATFRALDIGGWLVSADAVSLLFEGCKQIEEFAAALDQPGFEEFERRVTTMKLLHTAALRIYAGGGSTSIDDAERIMRKSVALRRLALDEMNTEVRKSQSESNLTRVYAGFVDITRRQNALRSARNPASS
ncbi:hypothetical protein C8F01DRAFT_1129199, partial [Mycena amicta]